MAFYLSAKGAYISPLWRASKEAGEEGVVQEQDDAWSRPDPPYTLYGTVTLSFVKYLTYHCLQRHSLLSEFFHGRPEFFLVVSARTLRLVTTTESGDGGGRRGPAFMPYGVLFQLVFDHEVLLTLPRSSFFPWRRTPGSADASEGAVRRVGWEGDAQDFYLVRMRPKVDLGLHPDASSEHLNFFVHSVYRNKSVRYSAYQ